MLHFADGRIRPCWLWIICDRNYERGRLSPVPRRSSRRLRRRQHARNSFVAIAPPHHSRDRCAWRVRMLFRDDASSRCPPPVARCGLRRDRSESNAPTIEFPLASLPIRFWFRLVLTGDIAAVTALLFQPSKIERRMPESCRTSVRCFPPDNRRRLAPSLERSAVRRVDRPSFASPIRARSPIALRHYRNLDLRRYVAVVDFTMYTRRLYTHETARGHFTHGQAFT